MYLFNITLAQRHNFSNDHMLFSHPISYFSQEFQLLLCAFFSVLWLWDSEDTCCYAHTAAVSMEQKPAPHLPIWWKAGQGIETPFGRDHLGLKWWTASLLVLQLGPLPSKLMHTDFCYSPACLQLLSLLLNSFQPSLK